jgi:PmbA protein
VVAEDLGESQSGWDIQTTRYFNRLLPELVAKESVENAVALLGAKPIRTRRIPVIFKNVVFAELLSAMIPAFLGDSVVKKKSMFADKLGYEIASHVVNIYDDPTSSEGTGSVPFDDEGTPTRKKALIERGVLKTFLTDLFYALKLQVEPTGNGIRSGISSPPKPGITNLVLERGALDLKELVQTPEEVILITDAMGLHTVNPVSGEFSVGISGLFYKDGKLVQPISGMTVAGNLRELLLGINQVGKDVKWLYNVASPSVLVKSLTVSGI